MLNAGLLKILAGALILIVVIGIYVAVSYMHDKKMGKENKGCSGNCASCGMKDSGCSSVK